MNQHKSKRKPKKQAGSGADRKQLEGIVKRHADGFGFFIPDDSAHQDVYLPKNVMTGVMTSDRVLIEVFPEPGGDRYRGEVIKVLQRGISQGVGKFHPVPEGGKWGGEVRDDGHGWGSPLKILPEDCDGAKADELIVFQITSYPDESNGLMGRVVGHIGDIENPLNDIQRVIHGNRVPHEFPEKVVHQAESLPQTVLKEDFVGRKDLTATDFITIDGVTAKDFDDAIAIKAEPSGFRLWVAIADVSHYVKPGTDLDAEAYIRGNSTYFPGYVVPMLPEALSNGICSLNPHVNRLALVAEMLIDFDGTVTNSDFYEAVICSKARVTYGEAQEVLDGQTIETLKHVEHVLKKGKQLAEILMKKRFANGSLDLEIPETSLIIDDAGEPVDVIKTERLFSHRLIEEMMLIANVTVARFFVRKEITAIYRVHDKPKMEDIDRLSSFLSNAGGHVRLTGAGSLQKKLTKALAAFRGKPEALVLNSLTLRSLAQAQYSPDNIGHFGLGFEDYTHFTSPIRRYPDLIVHRLLKSAFHKGYQRMSEEELQRAGTSLSATEQRSVKAERQLYSIKKARLMKRHLGETFDGVVSSVTKFGVFVMLRAFDVDGLVRTDELFQEPFYFDEDNLALVGKRSGLRYTIGMPLQVFVAKADTETGTIDFQLTEEAKSAGLQEKKPKHWASVSKRGKTEKDRGGVRKARVSGDSGKAESRKVRRKKKK